jgi:hypothetical protein
VQVRLLETWLSPVCRQAGVEICEIRSGLDFGEVAEWSKALVSKTSVLERVPRVRISPSPHLIVFVYEKNYCFLR